MGEFIIGTDSTIDQPFNQSKFLFLKKFEKEKVKWSNQQTKILFSERYSSNFT